MHSFEAKAKFIVHRYRDLISMLQSLGCYPIFIGDAISDMEVAFAAGCYFIGMTESGEANRARFRAKIKEKARELGVLPEDLPVRLFRNIYDPKFHRWLEAAIRSYERKLRRAAAWHFLPTDFGSRYNGRRRVITESTLASPRRSAGQVRRRSGESPPVQRAAKNTAARARSQRRTSERRA